MSFRIWAGLFVLLAAIQSLVTPYGSPGAAAASPPDRWAYLVVLAVVGTLAFRARQREEERTRERLAQIGEKLEAIPAFVEKARACSAHSPAVLALHDAIADVIADIEETST